MSAVKEFKRLTQVAKEIRDTDHHVVPTCSVSDAWAQGDVAIIYLGKSRPPGLKETKSPVVQLAPGTTMGSRHCLDDLTKYSLFEWESSHPLKGPVVLANDGITVTHPEHGNVTIQESGYYGIRYQRAYAEEMRRVQD